DGHADVITGAGEGGGPHVKVFSGKSAVILDEFMAYDAGFSGGVRVAAGDVNADGQADVITGAGLGGGPHVRVFSEQQSPNVYGYYPYGPLQRTQIVNTMAFDPSYTDGVFVAAGDVNGDGRAELIVSQGTGSQAKVRVIRATDAQV